MAHAQRAAIRAALDQNACNLTRTALQLRIGRTTLYRLMDAYEIRETADDGGGTVAEDGGRPPARVTLLDGVWYLAQDR